MLFYSPQAILNVLKSTKLILNWFHDSHFTVSILAGWILIQVKMECLGFILLIFRRPEKPEQYPYDTLCT